MTVEDRQGGDPVDSRPIENNTYEAPDWRYDGRYRDGHRAGWEAALAAATPALSEDRLGAMLPTSLVRTEWPPNDGVAPGNERFDNVLASIRSEGIREPLTVNLDRFVIDGCHRLAAARLLGITHVPVRFWTGSEFVS